VLPAAKAAEVIVIMVADVMSQPGLAMAAKLIAAAATAEEETHQINAKYTLV
jgi:hypothetical protein